MFVVYMGLEKIRFDKRFSKNDSHVEVNTDDI